MLLIDGGGTNVRVWLLAQRVEFDPFLWILGIFSDPNRAKLAVAGHTGGDEELQWATVEWEVGWNCYRADLLWTHHSEVFPLEFWIIPFALDGAEEGSVMIHGPSPAIHVH
jgi:hypothetical protein